MRLPYSITRNSCLGLALSALTIITGMAQTAPPVDLTGSSLEDLMNIQVTSVSKKEQFLSKAAGSIYVTTQDDIRHSGATNVPDLLRRVPGVDVARINANTWAISIMSRKKSQKLIPASRDVKASHPGGAAELPRHLIQRTLFYVAKK
jgi:outer membrane receptor for ferrienterochelin and colicin